MNSAALRDAIIVDLDGKLAIIGDRNPYNAAQCGLDRINSVVRDIALSWLKRIDHKVKSSWLQVGKKYTLRRQSYG